MPENSVSADASSPLNISSSKKMEKGMQSLPSLSQIGNEKEVGRDSIIKDVSSTSPTPSAVSILAKRKTSGDDGRSEKGGTAQPLVSPPRLGEKVRAAESKPNGPGSSGFDVVMCSENKEVVNNRDLKNDNMVVLPTTTSSKEHLVYSRKKSKKTNCAQQLEDQSVGVNKSCSSPVTASPMTSCEKVNDTANAPQRYNEQYWKERFDRLQAHLSNCDNSYHEEYIHSNVFPKRTLVFKIFFFFLNSLTHLLCGLISASSLILR